MSKDKELKVKESTELSDVIDFEQYAGCGMEEIDKESIAIPFIYLLQAKSAAIENGVVEGAQSGMFWNNVTNELYDTLTIIPCHYRRRYCKWVPRKLGGGYRGDMDPVEVESGLIKGITENEKGIKMLNGEELHDTRIHYVLVKSSSGLWQRAILSLSKTQVKHSKNWIAKWSALKMKNAKGEIYTPASFTHIYHAETMTENKNGDSWKTARFYLDEPIKDRELFKQAVDFYNIAASGKVELQQDDVEGSATPKEVF